VGYNNVYEGKSVLRNQVNHLRFLTDNNFHAPWKYINKAEFMVYVITAVVPNIRSRPKSGTRGGGGGGGLVRVWGLGKF
jgi:hypothetical protein